MNLGPYACLAGTEILNEERTRAYLRNCLGDSSWQFFDCDCPPLCPEVPTPALVLDGTEGNSATTPDSAAFDVGTQPFAMELDFWEVTPGSDQVLASQWDEPDDRAWLFLLLADGRLSFRASEDGTATTVNASSTLAATTFTKVSYRVEFVGDNGSGGWEARFLTRPLDAPTWDQVGSLIGGTPDMTVFNSTAPVRIGAAG